MEKGLVSWCTFPIERMQKYLRAMAFADYCLLWLGLNDNWKYGSTYSANEAFCHSIGVAPFIPKYFPVFDKFVYILTGSLEYKRRWREVYFLFLGETFCSRGYDRNLSYSKYNNEVIIKRRDTI